jgi:steroid 5-alpha reductase family enzyme
VTVDLYLINLGAVVVLMLTLWVISVAIHDASIVDPVWGLAFVLIAWTAVATTSSRTSVATLLVGLVTIWGLRLSIYLGRRNLGKGEDFRYQAMRRRYGARFPLISLFIVFLLQAGLAWVVSLPVQAGIQGSAGASLTSPLVLAGVVLWAIGLAFESVGDLQLARFKRDPSNQGQVLDRGLWRYTRHPNYFGDFLVWWGFFLVAAATGAWWTVVGPVLMAILLIRVSGAGLLEQTIGERRPGYADYIRRTSGFVPRPPRRP